MSVSSEVLAPPTDEDVRASAARLSELAERDLGQTVSDDVLQSAFLACIRIYGQKFEAGQRPRPIADAGAIDTTTLLLTVTALLRAGNVELFELGMWQTFSGIR